MPYVIPFVWVDPAMPSHDYDHTHYADKQARESKHLTNSR